MSDHETWLNDQDKTAQWPTTPPDGLGSSQGEHTEPLDVVPGGEGNAPTWAPEPMPGDAATAAQAEQATADSPTGAEVTGSEGALGQPSSDQPGSGPAAAAQAP
jgi:hypothetical protein